MRRFCLAVLLITLLAVFASSAPAYARIKAKKGETFADTFKRISGETSSMPSSTAKEKKKKAAALLELAEWAAARYLWPESDAVYEKVLEIDPDNKDARKKLDYLKYGGEWRLLMDAFRDRLEENEKKGLVLWEGQFVPKKTMVAKRAKERKTVGWDFISKDITGPFIIYSKTDTCLNYRLKRLAVELWNAFNREWGRYIPLKKGGKLPVYIAADKKDYGVIVEKKVHHPPSTYAFFSFDTKDSFFYPESSDYNKLAALFAHELTHALSSLALKGLPWDFSFWFLEGWSQYSEFAVWDNDTIRYGTIRLVYADKIKELRDALSQGKLMPLEEMFDMGYNKFASGNTSLHYAETWGFFYFMHQYEDCKYKAKFMKFLKMCCKCKGGAKTFKSIFGNIAPIEKEYHKWTNEDRPVGAEERPIQAPLQGAFFWGGGLHPPG